MDAGMGVDPSNKIDPPRARARENVAGGEEAGGEEAAHIAPSLEGDVGVEGVAIGVHSRAREGQRKRVPAAERREALIAAAVHEFASSGLHGTPVDRIARRVGVAQPYVFSLFAGKRELFIAAIDHCFDRFTDTFAHAAAEFQAGKAPEECEDVLMAMGNAYKELLATDRDYLMLQHQAYAACDNAFVCARVRRRYAELVAFVEQLSGADPERLDDFFRHGMALNVAAAMDVAELSAGCSWVQDELAGVTASDQDTTRTPPLG
jgi:AcrR family transcriptional regulator